MTSTQKRRDRGSGTIRERPPGSGRWQFRAFTGADPLTGRPHQITRTFSGTEDAAKRALRKLVREAEDGKFSTTTATVGQLLDKWLEAGAVKQRPRTLYENKSKIDHRIRPLLGKVRLDKLTSEVLDAAYRRWLDDGLSSSTVHKLHAILSSRWPPSREMGMDRPGADQPRATPPAPVRKPIVVPTPKRLTALVKAVEDDDPVLAAAITLAALTGARRGELVALKWSDVDLASGPSASHAA